MAPLLPSYDDALAYCSEQGMRLSKQRRLILKLLWETNEHLLASEIYDRLRQQGSAIGHTSVYQNLDALSRAGVIERVERANGCLYSRFTPSRFHVHCLDTNQVFDVRVTLPADLIAAIEAQVGFKVRDYHIEFFAHRAEETNDHTNDQAIAP
jgi:Fur family transcriptional regulator, ferric uptake regulator